MKQTPQSNTKRKWTRKYTTHGNTGREMPPETRSKTSVGRKLAWERQRAADIRKDAKKAAKYAATVRDTMQQLFLYNSLYLQESSIKQRLHILGARKWAVTKTARKRESRNKVIS